MQNSLIDLLNGHVLCPFCVMRCGAVRLDCINIAESTTQASNQPNGISSDIDKIASMIT